jgi:EAL domain-containing protein (putative c-di-GMP-specific phosphodiesterase class I)
MMTTASIGSDAIAEAKVAPSQSWSLVGNLRNNEGLAHVSIGKVPFTIGRLPTNDFCLPSNNVSKVHADIIVAVDAVLVRDFGSTNGTFVNGKRIIAPTPVGEGDLLQFADMEFRLARTNSSQGERTAVSDRLEDGWLISRMHEVVNLERFTIAFQPIVEAGNLRPTAVEALVRCQVTGLESPPTLFDAAARLGMEERLSGMCRSKAVKLLAAHPESVKLFLNTDPREYLGPELVRTLAKLREQAGTRQLVLEIHEQAVPDLAAMGEFRAALRDMEIGLAYDDFGVGQSRLLELTRIPPDYLKFDRSLLLESALASAGHRALIQSLVKHATDCGVATVAEGLENQETVDACRELGFTHFQGYHLGRPVPCDALRHP